VNSSETILHECDLSHWSFIISLLLYSEVFCNWHHLKLAFITKTHIS